MKTPSRIVTALALLFLAVGLGLGVDGPAVAAVGEASPRPQAVDLPPLPAGPPVVTVATDSGPRAFSLADLEAVGLKTLTADLLWQGESGTYQGILLADLLRETGLAAAPAVEVEGLDGYRAIIPREDINTWDVLLATRRDGRPMAVRDKGPLRILYAMTPKQLLEVPQMDTRWVWMVRAIRVAPPPREGAR